MIDPEASLVPNAADRKLACVTDCGQSHRFDILQDVGSAIGFTEKLRLDDLSAGTPDVCQSGILRTGKYRRPERPDARIVRTPESPDDRMRRRQKVRTTGREAASKPKRPDVQNSRRLEFRKSGVPEF